MLSGTFEKTLRGPPQISKIKSFEAILNSRQLFLQNSIVDICGSSDMFCAES